MTLRSYNLAAPQFLDFVKEGLIIFFRFIMQINSNVSVFTENSILQQLRDLKNCGLNKMDWGGVTNVLGASVFLLNCLLLLPKLTT